MRRALGRLARRAGIVAQYTDQTGRVRRTAPETEAALLAAMGFDCSSAAALEAEAAALARPRALPEWRVLTAGRRARLPGLGDATAWEIETEAGGALAGRGPALPALPAGIHRLRAGRDEGREAACWLIAAPRSLALPPRGWGVTLPLYGLRTPDEGGLGDYADLAAAAAGLAAAGADFLGINPVHAGFPAVPGAASPYQPSDRRRLATGHIHVPGAAPAARGALIDYRAEMPARMAALERAWAGFAGSEAFEAFRAREGAALRRFALHAAIAEREGPFWPDWPEPLRRPDSPEVAALARALAPRVRFHEWLQFEADRQLGAAAAAGAGMRHGLYLDLAVGVHPAGAETWAEQINL